MPSKPPRTRKRPSRDRAPAGPHLVQDDAAMDAFLEAIDREDRLGLDTEANSMFAYRERCCLIQVSCARGDWILDPLADLDLEPFLEILEDPEVLKVLHDAEFDILILGREYELRLEGLFDTKVAAVALGRKAVGLASMVEECFGVQLDKSQQRSDWGRRPLEPQQLDYAAKDTRYLIPLMDRLEDELDEAPELLQDEIESEFRRLERLDWVRKVPEDPWLEVKGVRRLQPEVLRVFKELHAWREKEAERRNLPLFKVLSNPVLIELAKGATQPGKVLDQQLGKRQRDRYASTLRALFAKARDKDPIRLERPKPLRGAALRAAEEEKLVLDRLKAWRKGRAERRPTDPSHILNREVMETLAGLDPRPEDLSSLEETGLLEDWRLEAYGEEIVEALRGEE